MRPNINKRFSKKRLLTLLHRNTFFKNKKGVSTLFIAIYICLLALTLISALFLGVAVSRAGTLSYIQAEQLREQESISLVGPNGLKVLADQTTVDSILIKNTGTVTVRITGIYIGSTFKCDPSQKDQVTYDTYISPKTNRSINLLPFDITLDKIDTNDNWTIVTERGTKAIKTAEAMINGNSDEPHQPPAGVVIGPLMLYYDQFVWKLASTDQWAAGWTAHDFDDLTWRIKVTNVADRNIYFEKESYFALLGNDIQSNFENVWGIALPEGQDNIMISPTESKFIYFDVPVQIKSNIVVGMSYINYLTIMGHYEDGSTFGQTLAFESVRGTSEPKLTISASANTIYLSKDPSSTVITVTATDQEGHGIPDIPINFEKTVSNVGVLSDTLAATNNEGQAQVTLLSGNQLGTITITAICQDVTIPITITIAS